MGNCSSVIRALVAQASDLSSITSDFPIFFSHSVFQSERIVLHVHLSIYLPGSIEPSH